MHVAYSPNLDLFQVDPDVARIVRQGVRAFEELGCVVDEVKPGFADTRELIRIMWSAHEAGNRAAFLPQWRERMDPGLVACIEAGSRYTAVEYVQARDRKIAFWDTVTAVRALRVLADAERVGDRVRGRPAEPGALPPARVGLVRLGPFSYPFNFTGQPAASLPAGFTGAGLPVGLQIVGRRCADLGVLQASAAFEAARPWAERRPPVS